MECRQVPLYLPASTPCFHSKGILTPTNGRLLPSTNKCRVSRKAQSDDSLATSTGGQMSCRDRQTDPDSTDTFSKMTSHGGKLWHDSSALCTAKVAAIALKLDLTLCDRTRWHGAPLLLPSQNDTTTGSNLLQHHTDNLAEGTMLAIIVSPPSRCPLLAKLLLREVPAASKTDCSTFTGLQHQLE